MDQSPALPAFPPRCVILPHDHSDTGATEPPSQGYVQASPRCMRPAAGLLDHARAGAKVLTAGEHRLLAAGTPAAEPGGEGKPG